MTRYVKFSRTKWKKIVEEHLERRKAGRRVCDFDEDKQFLEKQQRVVLRHCGLINPEKIDEYLAVGGYEATKKVVTSMTQDEVIEEIKVSGLRGRGGAGFPDLVQMECGKGKPGKRQVHSLQR